jgi:hypothetical protein
LPSDSGPVIRHQALAGNVNYRTNNALVETFSANSDNELSTISRSGTVTVAGTTTSPATNVTVNTTNAVFYTNDNTFAAAGFAEAYYHADGNGNITCPAYFVCSEGH